MRCATVLVFCWASAAGAGLAAQTQGTVAAGIGTVRTSAGVAANAVTVSSTLNIRTPNTAADAQTTLAALPHGEWNAQLRLDAWRLLASGSRGAGFALAAALAGSVLPGDARAGSAQMLGELVYQRGGGGAALAAGPVIGAIGGAAPETAPRVRARAWLQTERWRHTIGIEPTRFDANWYTDAYASTTLEEGQLAATLTVVGRVVDGGEARATANTFVAWRTGGRVTIEGGYGGFLSDPFLGFGRATAASVGVRVVIGRPAERGAAPLVARRRGNDIVVRVRVPGATTVSLAGEWAEWTAVPLRRLQPSGDIWEGVFVLAPGTYRFNLVVDGTRWTLPDRMASVPDGFGGRAGVLVVPAPPRL